MHECHLRPVQVGTWQGFTCLDFCLIVSQIRIIKYSLLGSPKEERTRPRRVKDYEFISSSGFQMG